jgi:hypothetical protein
MADKSPAWLLGVVAVVAVLVALYVGQRWFKREEDIFKANQTLVTDSVRSTANYESLSKQVIEGMRRYDEKLDGHGDKLERIERTIARIEVTQGGRPRRGGGPADAV